MSNELII